MRLERNQFFLNLIYTNLKFIFFKFRLFPLLEKCLFFNNEEENLHKDKKMLFCTCFIIIAMDDALLQEFPV